jgi:hypothetical protein
MSTDELLEVYSTDDPIEAEMMRNALRAEGLKCEIDGEGQAGLSGLGIMDVRLCVRAEDFDRARSFLEAHEQIA